MIHASITRDYAALSDNPERDRPPPIDPKFPWLIFYAAAGVKKPEGALAQHQRVHITWSPHPQPFYLNCPLPGFDPFARMAAETLTKDDLKGLQSVGDDIAVMKAKLNQFTDANYIEVKLDKIRGSDMTADKRVAAIASVEAERAAIPGIIAQINREMHEAASKFVPAGRKLISKTIEVLAGMINARTAAAKKDALEFSGQALSDLDALQQTAGVGSLCRQGSFCEQIADEVEDSVSGGMRALDILRAAGVIK